MPTITGKLNSATATGKVRFTPDHPFTDATTTPTTLVILPYEAAITNGQFSITVPQSQKLSGQPDIATEGVTYKIELFKTQTTVTFYFNNGTMYAGATHLHTDNIWYTGSTHTDASVRLDRIEQTSDILFQDPIHAIIPDTTTTIDFSTLVALPITGSNQDISVYKIAEMLSSIPKYRDRISSKFNYRGDYVSTATYTYNDVVQANGNSYVWRNASNLAGQAPPTDGSNTYWQMLSSKGATGAGTTAVIVGYNQAAWNNSNQAAARGDVEDAISSIPYPDLTNYYTKSEAAPRNNATFTGTTKRAAMTYPVATAEKPTEVPTVAYVESAIAALGVGALPKPMVYAMLSADQVISTGGVSSATKTIVWDSILDNDGTVLGNDGVITIPAAGSYLFGVMSAIRGRANNASETSKIIMRSLLYRITATAVEVGNFWRTESRAVYTNSLTNHHFGLKYQKNLAAGLKLDVRANVAITGGYTIYAGDSGEEPTIVQGSVGNNYLLIWKIG